MRYSLLIKSVVIPCIAIFIITISPLHANKYSLGIVATHTTEIFYSDLNRLEEERMRLELSGGLIFRYPISTGWRLGFSGAYGSSSYIKSDLVYQTKTLQSPKRRANNIGEAFINLIIVALAEMKTRFLIGGSTFGFYRNNLSLGAGLGATYGFRSGEIQKIFFLLQHHILPLNDFLYKGKTDGDYSIISVLEFSINKRFY